VFLAALVLRVAAVAHAISGAPAPQIRGEMLNIAENIAQGRGFSSPFGPGSTPTAWECPIVPYLFAGFLRFTPSVSSAVYSIVFAQAVVGAVSALAYWLIARKCARDYPPFRRWLLPVLGVAVVFWPESFLYLSDPWYCVWQEAALALFFLCAIRWWDRMEFPLTLALGAAGGILALINVTPLPVILFAILYPAARRDRKKGAIGQAAFCLCVLSFVVSPQLVRNAIVFRTFVPLRSNTGFELLKGNTSLECIREPDNARHPATDPEEFKKYTAVGEIRYCRDAFKAAIAYIAGHPGQTAERAAKRLYVIWTADLSDHWNPSPAHKWWAMGARSIVRQLIAVVPILASTAVVLWAVLTGRFGFLPHAPLFGAILLLLPFSHYLTLADPEYLTAFREWIGITAILLLARIAPFDDAQGNSRSLEPTLSTFSPQPSRPGDIRSAM
jgi:hypothetical protein